MAGAVADPAAPSALLEADGELSAQRDAPVGGQAVIEGVMMRGVANWAVAVRKPRAEQLHEDERSAQEGAKGEIKVTTYPLESAMRRHRVLRLPIVRGVVALGGSMVIGFRALEIAANAQLPPEQQSGESHGARTTAPTPTALRRTHRRSRAWCGWERSCSRSCWRSCCSSCCRSA